MSGVSIATGVIATDALGGGAGRGLQSPGTVAQSAAASLVTGTLTKTALATISIPGGMLSANGMLRISTLWSYTNSANNKIISIEFGGTAFFTATATTTNEFNDISMIRNRNSVTAQIAHLANGGNRLGTAGSAPTTGAVNTAVDQNVIFYGTLANTGETITLEAYTIEVINP